MRCAIELTDVDHQGVVLKHISSRCTVFVIKETFHLLRGCGCRSNALLNVGVIYITFIF